MLRRLASLDHLVMGSLLHPGHEEQTLGAPAAEECEVVVGPVHGDERARIQVQRSGDLDIGPFGLGDQHVGRHVVVVVEQDVDFDSTLGATELGPRKEPQTQRDGGRVQRQELSAELKFRRPVVPQHALGAEPLQGRPEQVLEEAGRTVLGGVGERGLLRCLIDAQVGELAQAAGQAVADLAQGVGLSQLAEQHGHELSPAGEPLRTALGAVSLDQCRELRSREVLQQLTEQARSLYHRRALRCLCYQFEDTTVPAGPCGGHSTSAGCFGQRSQPPRTDSIRPRQRPRAAARRHLPHGARRDARRIVEVH